MASRLRRGTARVRQNLARFFTHSVRSCTLGGNLSGTYVTSVDMLLMHDMMLETIAQPKAEPCSVPGWRMMGPTPCALTMHQMKNVMPAIGTTIALSVNRWRLCVGREFEQFTPR